MFNTFVSLLFSYAIVHSFIKIVVVDVVVAITVQKSMSSLAAPYEFWKKPKIYIEQKVMQIGEEICFAKKRIYARRFLLKLRLNNRPPPQPTTTFLHTYGKFA